MRECYQCSSASLTIIDAVKMWVDKKVLFSSSLVFAVSLLSYWSSLSGEFVFDDHRGILTNDDLDGSKTSLWDVFQHDFWGGHMSRVESHKSYRPLTVLTYRYLNFYFSGLEPYGYHVTSVLIHGLASVLVIFLSRLVLGAGNNSIVSVGMNLDFDWSTYCGTLFAVHSIHTEAVASIVGRAEVISCIFLILSFISYCKGISTGCGDSLSSLSVTKWSYVATSIFLSTCALLSKEQGIVAIGLCAAFDLILHWDLFWERIFNLFQVKSPRRPGRGNSEEMELLRAAGGNDSFVEVLPVEMNSDVSVSNGGHNNGGEKSRKMTPSSLGGKRDIEFRILLKRIGILGLSGIALMWFRLTMNYNSQPIFKKEELRAIFHPNTSVRFLSFSNIYAINAWLLLSPSSLCCDWTLGSIPLITEITDVRNIWSLLLYAGIGILIVYVLTSSKDRMKVGMGLAFLLLPFLPASGLVFRVGFVIAERVLYMPSVGLCLLVTAGARRIACTLHNKPLKMMLCCFLVGNVVIMAAKTHSRSQDWNTDLKLFKSGVRVNPNNVKLRNNYGIELKAAGRVEEARRQYQASLAIDPEFGEVYMNMGNLLSDEKNYAESLLYFEKAVEFPQMYQKTLNNLGTTYFRLGRLEEAEMRFKESIQVNPDQPMTYNNLASLYGELKKYKESEKMFRKALKLNPEYTEAYFNLGTLFIQMGELDKGEKYLNKALQLYPQHSGALNNLKVIEHYRRNKR